MIPSWLLFVVLAQFLFAVAVLVDRFVVSKKVVNHPIVYAFYVCYLSIFVLGLLPFGIGMMSWTNMLLAVGTAVIYVLSIYLLYESLVKSNPSEVVPVIGGVSALAAFVGGSLILNEELPRNFLLGFAILVAGMLLISHFKFTLRSFIYLTGSGITFGLSTVILKLIFQSESFIDGFFWTRLANVLVAILLLLIPSVYHHIKFDNHQERGSRKRKALIVVGNKVLAGLASVFVLIAISLGNVSMINALTAMQYVFLMIFAIFFSKLLPEYFSEKVHKHEFLHKSLAAGLIIIGFFILFV